MRKLGLILVLLFTLSIASAADFTLSGKIDAKSGASIIDQNYNVKYTFSDGTVYGGDGVLKVAITNGVFTADFSGLPDAETVLADSNSVDMEITGLADTSGNVGVQTFSNIPLTTVPKSVYAETASEPFGNWAVPGVLKLDRPGRYDVWLQGSTAGTDGGDARNLALLGIETWSNGDPADKLYVNYGAEYKGGTVIDGAATFLKDVVMDLTLLVKGSLTVNGDTTTETLTAGATTLGATTTETLTAGATTATSLYASNLLRIGAFYFDPARSTGADSWLRLLDGDNGAYKDLAVGKLYAAGKTVLKTDVDVEGDLIVDGDVTSPSLDINTYYSAGADGTGGTLCSNSDCTSFHGFFGGSSSGDKQAYCPPGTRAISCGARKSSSGEDVITCTVVGERQATWSLDVNGGKDWKRFYITCLGTRTDL